MQKLNGSKSVETLVENMSSYKQRTKLTRGSYRNAMSSLDRVQAPQSAGNYIKIQVSSIQGRREKNLR